MPRFFTFTLALAIGAALLAQAGPAPADIYGYVDEQGVAHLSNVKLDDRYYLFKKEPNPAPAAEGPDAGAPDTAPQRGMRFNAADRQRYAQIISTVAKEHGLEAALLHALITVESGYDARARSPKGAMGLTQLMPDTARRYQVADIWDPRENVRGGARYLRDLLGMFGNDLSLALAAYNAGEAAVLQYGRKIPPYPETRNYVPRVLQQYRLLSGEKVY
jgi:soluble lytic murein transglycosylase-like protein